MANLPIPGRTYDVALFQGPNGSINGRQTPALLSPSGVASSVTGIVKLVQRATLEFFTRKGSMTFKPLRGTTFLDAVTRGAIKTDVDVYQEFGFASADVLKNLLADQKADDPLDERLTTFELTSFALSAGQITLNVKIENAAGSGIIVPLPITTTV